MKKILLLLLLCTSFGFSQVTNSGEPKSWSVDQNTPVQKIEIPANFDIQEVVQEDRMNDHKGEKPYRVGIPTKINYGFESGTWTELPNGDRFWRFNIASENAIHLSVIFDDFHLPEGSNLYLYNDERSDLQGAYTSINNNEHNVLGSWFVDGDNLWIEYFEPFEVRGQGRLHLSDIFHGYRMAKQHQLLSEQRDLNDSGNCNHDVDCPIGNDFEPLKDELKHSVALINLGGGLCSGALVNNVNNDKTPYFLSANHCFGGNPSAYSFRFNWITPGTPRCGVTTNSTSGASQFINGSILRARDGGTDFMLLELNSTIPNSWNIRFAGWDRTDANPTFQVGIHHPSGDIMKVCRDNMPAFKTDTSFNGFSTDIWLIRGIGFGAAGDDGWDIGVTEGGSSGSPLFDQNGRIIGVLSAGNAACSGTNDNNGFDFYGRFGPSWNGGGTNTSRLSNWLDPDSTGTTIVDMLDNAASVNDPILEANITIYPNPTKGIITIDLGELTGDFTYKIVNPLGQEVSANILEGNNSEINLAHLTNNIYFVKLIDTTNNRTLVKKVVLQK